MNGPTRVLTFVAGCAVVFGVALGVGRLVGPVASEPAEAAHDGEMADMAGTDAMSHHDVGGLEAAANGYTLTLAQPSLGTGRQRLAFTITDADGHPVTAYDEQHERDLHLVVVRRDLTGFQHVHPELDPATGEWSVDTDLTAGAWRVVADFTPADGEQQVLGTDLMVPGEFVPQPLGADNRVVEVDGYEVTLDRTAASHEETVLTATVTRDGEPVRDLQPYLGAYGHLVALRDGDVGYLHVHPEEGTGPGPDIAFGTTFPSAGRYRLFLDFRHGDVVHTATFTVTVDEH
jgi:hypothetical protein